MFNHRLARTAAIAIVLAATGAPAASAMPIDNGPSLDALPADPTRAVEPPQDLRNPDTRDFAEGRGTYNAPEVLVVKAPVPAPIPTSSQSIPPPVAGSAAGTGALTTRTSGAL